jgi:hypothetical protein
VYLNVIIYHLNSIEVDSDAIQYVCTDKTEPPKTAKLQSVLDDQERTT